MAFAILRTEKLKTAASIRGAGGHNNRTRPTLNADPEKKIESILDGGPDLFATVMNKIESAGAKHRSNSVLAQEIFLSASPEFFRPGDPAAAGVWEPKKLAAWREASTVWLQKHFGKNIVDVRLHLDESTPHMHAVVVPLTADNRLSARDVFSKKTLREMQTSYAQELSSLGLERGIEGSKARHTKIREFYAAVNSAERIQTPQINTPDPMLKKSTREEYANVVNEHLETTLRPVINQAETVQIARKKKKEYVRTAQKISEKNWKLEQKLKESAKAARGTPLPIVLTRFGLEKDPKDKSQWIGSGHRITVKDQKFYDHNHEKGGGGAIDLVKHLNDCDFKTAVAWLGQEIDITAAAASIRADAERTAKTAIEEKDLTFQPPELVKNREFQLKTYLNNVRGLDPKITAPLIAQGRIYATEKNGHVNAVFLAMNNEGITGAEIKGVSGKFSGMATNSKKKKGAFSVGDYNSKHAVFVESAIDALSYVQLHPDKKCVVISTAGATTAPPFVQDLQDAGYKLTVAYDNDKIGLSFAKKFKEKFSKTSIERPHGKDWNVDLQNQKQGQSRDQDRGYGM